MGVLYGVVWCWELGDNTNLSPSSTPSSTPPHADTVSERLKKEYKTEWNVASGHENFPAASSVSAVCPNSDKDSCSALDYLLATYCLDGPTQNCTRDMAQIVGAPAPGAGRQRQLRH